MNPNCNAPVAGNPEQEKARGVTAGLLNSE
jgi:hypothetical protein